MKTSLGAICSERQMRNQVVLDAIPFGFGPTGKLLAIVEAIAERRLPMRVLSHPTNDSLIRSSVKELQSQINLTNVTIEPFDGDAADGDVVVSVMNERTLELAQSRGRVNAAVDSLFWMWDEPPQSFRSATRYFIQKDRRNRKNEAAFLMPNDNHCFVGRITSKRSRRRDHVSRDFVLFSVGGVSSPLTRQYDNERYVSLFSRIISEFHSRNPGTQVRVACPPQYIELCSQRLSNTLLRPECLGHRAFLNALGSARAIVTSPGLTTLLEAFEADTPVLLLPAQNYSQYFNATLLNGGPIRQVLLQDVSGAFIPHGLDEEHGVELVTQGLYRLCISNTSANTVVKRLESGLEAVDKFSTEIADYQRILLGDFGADGANEIATWIEQVLKQPKAIETFDPVPGTENELRRSTP